MADIQSGDSPAGAGDARGTKTGPPARRRRWPRIALPLLTSLAVLLGTVAAGGFVYVNHVVGSIPRIHVKFLAQQTGARGGMTVLLTSREVGPTGAQSGTEPEETGLIMLLHLNADGRTGGVVSIPPQTEVRVPGHGRDQLGEVMAIGGPSLLVETVHELTGVPISHYVRIDFNQVDAVVDALRGVTVTLPATTVSFGHVFHKGPNRLYGLTALYYARQPSLSEEGRVLRQSSLIRAVIEKLARENLMTSPVTMVHVLKALARMLAVDSDFTNFEIERLAFRGRSVVRAGTFIVTPTEVIDGVVVPVPVESSQLWAAIYHDSLAAFAREYPDTVTPIAVP